MMVEVRWSLCTVVKRSMTPRLHDLTTDLVPLLTRYGSARPFPSSIPLCPVPLHDTWNYCRELIGTRVSRRAGKGCVIDTAIVVRLSINNVDMDTWWTFKLEEEEEEEELTYVKSLSLIHTTVISMSIWAISLSRRHALPVPSLNFQAPLIMASAVAVALNIVGEWIRSGWIQ